MDERTPPPEPPRARSKREKAARLAEALRANLARRKAQKRARAPAGKREGRQD